MRCACGPESHHLSPLRVIKGDADLGEQTSEEIERGCGERPSRCPWLELSDPFVTEVVRARKWWVNGELDEKYPHGVPNVIVMGVEIYDGALNGIQVYDVREDREARRLEQQKRDLEREGKAR